MSYATMLTMRANVLQAVESQIDGLTQNTWEIFASNVKCRLDLGFIRVGRDPVWTPETGTAQNRGGVLFIHPSAKVIPGFRIQMITGPKGTFEIASNIDEAWGKRSLHHLECYVKEIDRTLANS